MALLVLSELAAATGGVPRATSMLVRAGAGEPVPSRAGVVLERLSMLYASLGMRRKAAMHLVLSGHQSQVTIAVLDCVVLHFCYWDVLDGRVGTYIRSIHTCGSTQT